MEADAEDVPEELLEEQVEAEAEVFKLEKMLARAKDRQKDAKQARGFYHRDRLPGTGKSGSGKGRDAGHGRGGGKGSDRIQKLKARTHCAVCSKLGHWKGDPECPGPPRKVHINAGEDEGQPEEAERPSEGYFTSSLNWRAKEQQIAKQSFFIDSRSDGVHTNYPTMNVIMATKEELLQQCGGKLLPDSCCAKAVGGQVWYDDIKKRLAKLGLQPIEIDEHEMFRFGAGKPVASTIAALIPLAVKGRHFTLRISIVPCLVPGLLSQRALGQLGAIHDHGEGIGESTMTFRKLGVEGLELGQTKSGHPSFSVLEFDRARLFAVAPDVSPSQTEIRLLPPSQRWWKTLEKENRQHQEHHTIQQSSRDEVEKQFERARVENQQPQERSEQVRVESQLQHERSEQVRVESRLQQERSKQVRAEGQLHPKRSEQVLSESRFPSERPERERGGKQTRKKSEGTGAGTISKTILKKTSGP